MVRDNGVLKGKINWFDNALLIKLKLIDKELIDPTEQQLDDLKIRCMEHLKKEKFIFFPVTKYRTVIGRTGKLKEFGVQFHHIE